MSLEEGLNRLALVCREVISDYVDFFAAPLVGHDVAEEGDELLAHSRSGQPGTRPCDGAVPAASESRPHT